MANTESHFCAGMRYRITLDGRIWFLVIEYNEEGRPVQVKFPGGTNKGQFKEDPPKTLQREWREEVGGKKLHTARPIREHRLSPDHVRIFFLLDADDWPEEGMRTERLVEKTENGHRRDEILGPPMWMEEEELRVKIFHSHKPAFEEACEWIRKNDPAFQTQ